MIRKFADAIADTNPLYRSTAAAQAAGYPDVVAPPTFLNLIPYARINPFDAGDISVEKTRSLHAEQRFIHHRPLHAGEQVMLRSTIVGIRQAGAYEMLDLLGEVRTIDGELVATANQVGLFRGDVDSSAASKPKTPTEAANSTQLAAVSLDEGLYPTQNYDVRQLDLLTYAGASGEYEPIHWSERAAHDAGMPGVIAHGMFTMAKTAQALTTWFGDPGLIRELAVRFSRPLVVGEIEPVRLSICVTDSSREAAGGLRLQLDVRSAGQQILTRASAVVLSRE
jgi:acyl dehydratase